MSNKYQSPVQTITVRAGDFFVGESATKPCEAWSCREKAIGFGKTMKLLIKIVVV